MLLYVLRSSTAYITAKVSAMGAVKNVMMEAHGRDHSAFIAPVLAPIGQLTSLCGV